MFKLNSFSCRSRAWQIIGTTNYSEITDLLTGKTLLQNGSVWRVKSNPVLLRTGALLPGGKSVILFSNVNRVQTGKDLTKCQV
jgi:hypothetical protein